MRCVAASSAISPAPMSMALCPCMVPKIRLASSTAAKLMDTADEATAVSVRTRLATEKAL